jgi:hypothetical protein
MSIVGHPKIMPPDSGADTGPCAACVRRADARYSAGKAVLTGEYLPLLLQTAGAISADRAACQAAPQIVKPGGGRVSAGQTG